MEQRFISVAEAGDTEALYALIREDASPLESIDKKRFVDTPLHIAASRGHINFAMEMVTLMPSYARKLNPDGYSPLHLALQNEKTDLIFCLIKHDKDLIRVKGKNGMTPLHYTAAQENLFFLAEFLAACPQCMEDVTNLSETPLHIALKNNKTEAFILLARWLLWSTDSTHKDAAYLKDIVLNWMDYKGNNVLHIATHLGQAQVVRLLCQAILVDVKAKNMDNLTALDIAKQSGNREILNMLRWLEMFNFFNHRAIILFFVRERERMSYDTRNALLVVFTLVATANFDATLSPPGGLWQGQASNDSPLPGISVGFDTNKTIATVPPPGHLGKVIMDKNSFDDLMELRSRRWPRR